MKRFVAVFVLVLLAGCASAPWGQPAPDEDMSGPSLQINNSSEDYAYVIGAETETSQIRPHTVSVKNNITEPVEVAVTADKMELDGVSLVVEPNETRKVKVQRPINYTITVVGPTESLEKQFNIYKTKFDCNSRTHLITVNDDVINQTVISTMMACSE